VAFIIGDHEAAKRVELNLPETGVCNVDFSKNKQVKKEVLLEESIVGGNCGTNSGDSLKEVETVLTVCCS